MSQARAADVILREACAELERRVAAGDSYSADSVFSSHPALGEDADAALEVVYTEFVAREQLGQRPAPEEFCTRFPQWRAGLEQLFQIHRAAGGASVAGPSQTPTPERVPHLSALDGSPRRVGNYEILGELGRGGMGVVYEARQVGLNRRVALKMILTGVDAGPRERARFRTEAEAAARLQHPNIVQIYEVGEHEGRPFLSMELVDGGSLDERLRGAPCPSTDAARVIEMLARAMHHAHEHGVVHRDLKPANVLLSCSGRPKTTEATAVGHSPGDSIPKITDFGLARRLSAGPEAPTALTAAGAVVGTPAYMAPEQASGAARAIGPAADIYSLGAILYELLTGRPPFQGVGLLETLEQVRFQEPVPPGRLMPGLARDIETICLKCLRKEPARRYASAAELADDLGRYLRGEPIRARPIGAWERGWKWTRRRPAIAALLASLVILTIVALTTITVLWRRTADALNIARAKQDETEAALAERLIALAQRDWTALDLDAARHHLDECPRAYRDEEWRYLNRVCRAELMRLGDSQSRSRTESVAWSADGRLVTASQGRAARVWDIALRRERFAATAASNGCVRAGFDAQGNVIVLRWNRLLPIHRDSAARPNRLDVQVLEPEEGRELSRYSLDLPLVYVLASRGPIVTVSNGRMMLIDRPSAPVVTPLFEQNAMRQCATLSADGRLLAFCSDSDVQVWDTATKSQVGRSLPLPEVSCLEFSPENGRLAVVRFDRAANAALVSVWDYHARRELVAMRGHDGSAGAVAFSPDGRWLATAGDDKTVVLWDPQSGREQYRFRGHLAGATAVAFSPDGTRLASGGSDGTVRIWDVPPH